MLAEEDSCTPDHLAVDQRNEPAQPRPTLRQFHRFSLLRFEDSAIVLGHVTRVAAHAGAGEKLLEAARGPSLHGSVRAEMRGRGAYRALVRARWDAAVERGTPTHRQRRRNVHTDPRTTRLRHHRVRRRTLGHAGAVAHERELFAGFRERRALSRFGYNRTSVRGDAPRTLDSQASRLRGSLKGSASVMRRGVNESQVSELRIVPRTNLHPPTPSRGNMNLQWSQRTSGVGAGR